MGSRCSRRLDGGRHRSRLRAGWRFTVAANEIRDRAAGGRHRRRLRRRGRGIDQRRRRRGRGRRCEIARGRCRHHGLRRHARMIEQGRGMAGLLQHEGVPDDHASTSRQHQRDENAERIARDAGDDARQQAGFFLAGGRSPRWRGPARGGPPCWGGDHEVSIRSGGKGFTQNCHPVFRTIISEEGAKARGAGRDIDHVAVAVSVDRQGEPHDGAVSRRAADADAAAMQSHESAHHREPEAAALFFRPASRSAAIERHAQPCQVFLRNADAGIVNGQRHAIAVAPCLHAEPRRHAA